MSADGDADIIISASLSRRSMAKRILVIGDNRGGERAWDQVLQTLEAEVEVAHNPLAAYPKLWRSRYDLVIAGVSPDPDRQEEVLKVLWQARKSDPKPEIILMTDFCGPDLAQHAQELGVTFCLKTDSSPSLLEQSLLSLGLDFRHPRAASQEGGIGDASMEAAFDGQ